MTTKTEPTLVFFHIPKTAGTTITTVFENEYGPENIFRIRGTLYDDDIKEFKSLSSAQQNSYRVITGHHSDELAKYLDSYRYLLFMRDPINQTISSFNHIKNKPTNRNYEQVKNMQTVEEFLDWQQKNTLDNSQSRYLAKVTARDLGWPKIGKVLTEEQYEKAKKFLNEVEYVFVTERFNEAIMVLGSDLNWDSLPIYKRMNQGQEKITIEPRVEQTILEVHKYDKQLYDIAKSRHQAIVATGGDSLKKQIIEFEEKLKEQE